ncbi:MAG: putative spermidine/putrescine transport system ATP-binding protein [Paracoccaceae bacterium]
MGRADFKETPMSGLDLQDVSKTYGGVKAVDHVSLTVPNGRFVCLLGPSGCGKTTLLRMIAGLEDPDGGRIVLDGIDLTNVPTHKRGLGMVFQSLALFPHLNVGDNIAYPLRLRGASGADRAARVAQLLDLVRLPGIADRSVARLSGGQKQRVAIARALSLSPGLFLLDEPLSALDAKLREAMQIELRQLQRSLAITTIVVTHDQREAMTMADLVVVMGQGRIRQVASPIEIYRNPADSFVADFIGTTNLIPIKSGAVLGRPMPGIRPEGVLSVRPEDLVLGPPDGAMLVGQVVFVRDLGATVETFVDIAGQTLTAVSSPRTRRHGVGDKVGITLPADACVVLAA